MSKIKTIKDEAELKEALEAAPGQVVLAFKMPGCEPCAVEQPKIERLAASCPTATVLQVDLDGSEGAEKLADKFDVAGTPTILFAEKGAGLAPGKAKELADADEALKKCKR